MTRFVTMRYLISIAFIAMGASFIGSTIAGSYNEDMSLAFLMLTIFLGGFTIAAGFVVRQEEVKQNLGPPLQRLTKEELLKIYGKLEVGDHVALRDVMFPNIMVVEEIIDDEYSCEVRSFKNTATITSPGYVCSYLGDRTNKETFPRASLVKVEVKQQLNEESNND